MPKDLLAKENIKKIKQKDTPKDLISDIPQTPVVSKTSIPGAFTRGFGMGQSLGAYPEIEAATQIPETIKGQRQPFGERKQQIMDYVTKAREQRPLSYGAGEFAGGILPAVAASAGLTALMGPPGLVAGAATHPWAQRLIHPTLSAAEGIIRQKGGTALDKAKAGGVNLLTTAAFMRGGEKLGDVLEVAKKTRLGSKVAGKVDDIMTWLSKKSKTLRGEAEKKAFLATKPSVAGLKKLERLPQGKSYVTKSGEVITDPKIQELGKVMLDENIIDTLSPTRKVVRPMEMYEKTLKKQSLYGRLKQNIINKADKSGQSPFNPQQLADDIDATIGNEMRSMPSRKDLIPRFEEYLDDLRTLDEGGGTVSYKKANELVNRWWKDIHTASGAEKRQWQGAEEVRQQVHKALGDAFEKISPETRNINRKYHNLTILRDYMTDLKNRDLLGKLDKNTLRDIFGQTLLGGLGVAGAVTVHPAIVVPAVSYIGLRNWQKKWGTQAQAKLLDKMSRKVDKIPELLTIDKILRDSLQTGQQSFLLTHQIMYNRNPAYKKFINETEKEVAEKKGEKTPYDEVSPDRGMRMKEQPEMQESEQEMRY